MTYSYLDKARQLGQYVPFSFRAQQRGASESTPQGKTPDIKAGTQSQETEQGETMMEMFGGPAQGMGFGTFPRFGLEDRGAAAALFGGGMQLGGNAVGGLGGGGLGGGNLVWGGNVVGGGGGGGEEVAAGAGQNGVVTPMPGHPMANAGGVATNQGWMDGLGGGGGDLLYGGSTLAQQGQQGHTAPPAQHQQQHYHGGSRVGMNLFPSTPQVGQMGVNGGATMATGVNGGPANGPAQSLPAETRDFPFLLALGDKIDNHDKDLVQKERALQTDDETDEKTEVLSYAEALTYMYMVGTNSVPRICHSPTLCPEDSVPAHSSMGGRVIVFTARNNVPLVAADRAFWDSKETMVPAGTDAIGQQADPAVFEWKTTPSGTKKHLRRALLFPSSLAKLGVEWINKGVDVLGCYRDLCTRFPGEDEYPDEKDWLLGASQGTPRDGSNLRLDFQQADQDEPTFCNWVKETLVLKKVIPVEPIPQAAAAPTQAAAAPTAPAAAAPGGNTVQPPPGVDPNLAFMFQQQFQQQQAMLASMHHQNQQATTSQAMLLNQFQHSLMGGVGGHLSSSSTSGKAAIRSEDTWAGITSLSHKHSLHQVSWWWRHVYSAKKDDISQKKQDAKKWILKWAHDNGLPVSKNFEPEDDAIWAWITGDFSSSTDYSKEGNKKLSPYHAMPVTTEELERRRTKKNAQDASAHTRTLADAVRIETEKGALPSPPGDLDTLVKTIVVFTGMVALLFGEKNDLYEKLMVVIETLTHEEVERNAITYLGVRSRQIFWLVLVEAKRYCNQAHSKWEFQQQKAFPTCNLHLYTLQLQNGTSIDVIGFPDSWKQPVLQVPPPPAAPTGGGGAPALGQWNGFQHPFVGSLPPLMPQAPVPAPVPPGLGQVPSQKTNKELLPARVTQACLKVGNLFPEARLPHFVAAAGKTMSDLPKIRSKVACYNYLMGKCTNFRCNFKHFELALLHATEYEEWIQTMEVGANKILEDKALPKLHSGRKRKSPSQ